LLLSSYYDHFQYFYGRQQFEKIPGIFFKDYCPYSCAPERQQNQVVEEQEDLEEAATALVRGFKVELVKYPHLYKCQSTVTPDLLWAFPKGHRDYCN
jgi:hypothetical protein